MSKGLKWKNLTIDHCPKCGSGIWTEDDGVTCKNSECDFFITKFRLEELKDKFGRDDIGRSNEFEGYGENFGLD